MHELLRLIMMAAQRKGLYVFTFTRYPWARILVGAAGIFLTLLFFAVDKDEEPQRRRLTKAPETQAFFIGDSPPEDETVRTYQ